MNVMKLVSLLTGLVIAGEALALLVGMHFLSGHNNPWISFKNDLFLGLDILAGAAVIILTLHSENLVSPLFWIALGLTLLTHTYRDWEYLVQRPNPFCTNTPLFVVNNLKLAGLFICALLGILQL
jgi:hypothetical protein